MTILLMTHLTMKRLNVYISCPMSVPQERINQFAKVVLKMGTDVDFWQRGTTYHDLALKRANVVIVLLEFNYWKQIKSTISKGTLSELDYALKNDIPVYLGYINGQKEYAIYETAAVSGMFTGMAGTSHKFKEMVQKWNDKYDGLSDSEKEEQLKQRYPTEYYTDVHGIVHHVSDDHVLVSRPVIVYGTPGGYDRRLLLLLR